MCKLLGFSCSLLPDSSFSAKVLKKEYLYSLLSTAARLFSINPFSYTSISKPNYLYTSFKMGLSSLPAPSEGVLCIILVNTAISIQIFKGIMRSILHIVGINLSSSQSSDSVENQSETFEFRLNPSDTFMEEFRSRIPTIRFGSVCNSARPDHDCSVCLTPFEPDSEINRLCCGHVYHKVCLEKWLDYWNITCPLCRDPLMPQEQEEASCIW